MMGWSPFRRAIAPALSATGEAEGGEADDAALVAAARADPRAFAGLYERHVGPIYRYCHVRTGSHEAAEDATSEVFLRALASLGGYRDGNFVAWLFRIARNVTVDATRRQRPTAPLAALSDPPDHEPTPEAVALAREQASDLRAALAMLSDEQRAAVELRLAGWSGEQIGAVLGKSPDAVKMIRSRAGAPSGDPRARAPRLRGGQAWTIVSARPRSWTSFGTGSTATCPPHPRTTSIRSRRT